MFTGLVEELGKVQTIVRGSHSVCITITARTVLTDVAVGDSIAVNGTCLTVVAFGSSWFRADVMPETVDRTVLATLKSGELVNLERTLRVGDRLGGHIVAGHVDGVGQITAKKQFDNAILVTIHAGPEIMRYIIAKGSVAIDGTSLTVVDFGSDWFSVSLIPHTAGRTTVGIKTVGDKVNLESDLIGKYVEKLLHQQGEIISSKETLTWGFLHKNGFVD